MNENVLEKKNKNKRRCFKNIYTKMKIRNSGRLLCFDRLPAIVIFIILITIFFFLIPLTLYYITTIFYIKTRV